MKRFAFSLQSVLNVRKTRRDAIEIELFNARAALRTELEKLAEIDAMIRRAMDPELIIKNANGYYLLQREKYLKILKDQRKRQNVLVRLKEAAVAEAMRNLKNAMIELRKMEKARDREHDQWREDSKREELKFNDELGTRLAFFGTE